MLKMIATATFPRTRPVKVAFLFCSLLDLTFEPVAKREIRRGPINCKGYVSEKVLLSCLSPKMIDKRNQPTIGVTDDKNKLNAILKYRFISNTELSYM